MKKTTLNDRIYARVAALRHKAERRRIIRVLGGRGALTVALGAALSIGGLSDSFSNVHFLVQKDLDSVRVVRQNSQGERLLANVQDGFAANTLFKISRALPDKLVTPQLSLFEDSWLPAMEEVGSPKARQVKRDVFTAEMSRISDAIRREFFSSSMPYGDLIHEKAEKYDVDPALVAAVIEQESRFRKRAISPVGARGLMQLMPRTGRWMGARDLYDPEQNVDAGVKYIKYLHKRFDGNLKKTIAAYNAGEGNVQRYGGIPPFRETQTYVKKVMKNYDKRKKQLQKYEERAGGSVPEADGSLTVR
jgi:hypothetical protein